MSLALSNKRIKQILLYFIVSGGAAIVNLASRFLYSEYFDYTFAVISAYLTGMFFNFILSSLFVFKLYAGADIKFVFIKFFIIAFLGLAITTFSASYARKLLLLLDLMPMLWTEFIAHAFGIGVSFIASFTGHHFFTYRATGFHSIIKGIK